MSPESVESPDPPEASGVFVRVQWPDWADVPLSFANQFVLQNNEHEVYLTIGQLAPPLLVGTPEELRAQAEDLQFVPAHCIARLIMTLEQTKQLHGALTQHLDLIEKQRDRGGGDGED